MAQSNPLSVAQMTAVLDNAPVAVYVSALESWELLYANRLARKTLCRGADIPGTTCYQAAGYEKPCPFCRMSSMSDAELLVREFYHPVHRRVYQLSGKIIDWDGRPAHIEYGLDVTEKKREQERSETLREELQATFSSIPCGLSVYRFNDEQITPVFHNPAFYEIMGYSDEHIRSIERETTFLGVHPDEVERLRIGIVEAVRSGALVDQTYRIWNDRRAAFCWIHLEGSVKAQDDGSKLLYGVYSDVSERMRLERELIDANEKMQDIVNAIPGGVAIYKVSDIFETTYFSDGVAQLTGYTSEEYQQLIQQDAAEMIYVEDAAIVLSKAAEVIQSHGIAKFEFRKQHRDGHIVWVRVQMKWVGEDEGCPLLHCVFHNITDSKEAQLEMAHLVNSIPGGIASYRIEGKRFIPTYYSDGVVALSGYTRQEYEEVVRGDAFELIYEPDRKRVFAVIQAVLTNGDVLDVSYRMRHKDGHLIWIHLNGRRMGPLSDSMRFYAVFTGMSSETRLFQSIANETADGIYVIDKQNYDLLYVNESKDLFLHGGDSVGQKCYAALHGKTAPCSFCTLNSQLPDGTEHKMPVAKTDRFYVTRFRETEWNGIPAYVKYVRDTTEEVNTRKEKERLEQYFQTIVKNLPGGVAVVRYEKDGSLIPEFLSDGFAQMTGVTLEEAWRIYKKDAMAGVHPDDCAAVNEQMAAYIASGENHCEIVYRLRKGDDGYIWVKNTLTMIQNEGGDSRVYAVYHDMTKEREEQERIRQQYNDLILQHYRKPGPNALIVGHCNVTQNRIYEIIDYTHSALLDTFGLARQEFFQGIAGLIVDEAERQTFLNMYLNEPALAAFARKDTEQILTCFIKLPQEEKGRYVQFKVILVETPDTGDITGILTVTDVTEQTISDRILHQLSVTNYDFVIDLNLEQDTYTILTCNKKANCVPASQGKHSEHMAGMLQSSLVPKDRERYARALEPCEIKRRLKEKGSYTFSFSMVDEQGDIRTKNMTVSEVDLRIGRVCLVRIDITDSVREQQGLLNMIAYTFELAGFIHVGSDRFTLYTRRTVLENLSPYLMEHYGEEVKSFSMRYGVEADREEVQKQFRLETMLQRLAEQPAGYDFVFPYRSDKGMRYKQINVLWGDENHRTVCLVQADVTDMLTAERNAKRSLEHALMEAKEANRAKSDFLSAMSHDIRTPMNAIIGMTMLAVAHLDDKERIADCLQKISVSSKHLLSLINDVLDMSKIEQSKILLNQIPIAIPELLNQLSVMMTPQAKEAGLNFSVQVEQLRHPYVLGDPLRINQILINILSNAIKFTPEGGRVDFLVEELEPKKVTAARFRFTVSDTGIGMSEGFITHLFDPFARNSSVTRVEGTGLGLSITKGLVDLMEGDISVESQVNRGTIFRVELECEISQEKERIHPEAMAESFGSVRKQGLAGRRFLVVEDNAINAEILTELLSMLGAESIVRPDGRQAVRTFQAAPPQTFDAILMDIQMPVMNGYEATKVIRKMDRDDAADIPIIAMTANAFAEDVQASLDVGMTAHVAKPIDVDVLQNTLYTVLDRKGE